MRTGAGGELIPRRGWSRRFPRNAALLPGGSLWATHDGLRAISSLEDAKYPSGVGAGPQWHISVAYIGERRRATNTELLRAVDGFGMDVFDEDNHAPGEARHLWMPVDPAERTACECKTSERTMVEPDGYAWTTPVDEAEGCRGCDHERMTTNLGWPSPCPIHKP